MCATTAVDLRAKYILGVLLWGWVESKNALNHLISSELLNFSSSIINQTALLRLNKAKIQRKSYTIRCCWREWSLVVKHFHIKILINAESSNYFNSFPPHHEIENISLSDLLVLMKICGYLYSTFLFDWQVSLSIQEMILMCKRPERFQNIIIEEWENFVCCRRINRNEIFY